MLVALARTAASAVPRSGMDAPATKAGNVSSVPPPESELTAPATSAVRHSHNKLRSGIVYGSTIA